MPRHNTTAVPNAPFGCSSSVVPERLPSVVAESANRGGKRNGAAAGSASVAAACASTEGGAEGAATTYGEKKQGLSQTGNPATALADESLLPLSLLIPSPFEAEFGVRHLRCPLPATDTLQDALATMFLTDTIGGASPSTNKRKRKTGKSIDASLPPQQEVEEEKEDNGDERSDKGEDDEEIAPLVEVGIHYYDLTQGILSRYGRYALAASRTGDSTSEDDLEPDAALERRLTARRALRRQARRLEKAERARLRKERRAQREEMEEEEGVVRGGVCGGGSNQRLHCDDDDSVTRRRCPVHGRDGGHPNHPTLLYLSAREAELRMSPFASATTPLLPSPPAHDGNGGGAGRFGGGGGGGTTLFGGVRPPSGLRGRSSREPFACDGDGNSGEEKGGESGEDAFGDDGDGDTSSYYAHSAQKSSHLDVAELVGAGGGGRQHSHSYMMNATTVNADGSPTTAAENDPRGTLTGQPASAVSPPRMPSILRCGNNETAENNNNAANNPKCTCGMWAAGATTSDSSNDDDEEEPLMTPDEQDAPLPRIHRRFSILHSAVVAYGHEYFFEGGIGRAAKGKSRFGPNFRYLRLGYTRKTKQQFEAWAAWVERIKYDLAMYRAIGYNCHTFTNEAALFLLLGGAEEEEGNDVGDGGNMKLLPPTKGEVMKKLSFLFRNTRRLAATPIARMFIPLNTRMNMGTLYRVSVPLVRHNAERETAARRVRRCADLTGVRAFPPRALLLYGVAPEAAGSVVVAFNNECAAEAGRYVQEFPRHNSSLLGEGDGAEGTSPPPLMLPFSSPLPPPLSLSAAAGTGNSRNASTNATHPHAPIGSPNAYPPNGRNGDGAAYNNGGLLRTIASDSSAGVTVGSGQNDVHHRGSAQLRRSASSHEGGRATESDGGHLCSGNTHAHMPALRRHNSTRAAMPTRRGASSNSNNTNQQYLGTPLPQEGAAADR